MLDTFICCGPQFHFTRACNLSPVRVTSVQAIILPLLYLTRVGPSAACRPLCGQQRSALSAAGHRTLIGKGVRMSLRADETEVSCSPVRP